jgi:hypothetical protein
MERRAVPPMRPGPRPGSAPIPTGQAGLADANGQPWKWSETSSRQHDGPWALSLACPLISKGSNGEGGIRTHGGFHLAGFQDRSHRPLDHLSRGWSGSAATNPMIPWAGLVGGFCQRQQAFVGVAARRARFHQLTTVVALQGFEEAFHPSPGAYLFVHPQVGGLINRFER